MKQVSAVSFSFYAQSFHASKCFQCLSLNLSYFCYQAVGLSVFCSYSWHNKTRPLSSCLYDKWKHMLKYLVSYVSSRKTCKVQGCDKKLSAWELIETVETFHSAVHVHFRACFPIQFLALPPSGAPSILTVNNCIFPNLHISFGALKNVIPLFLNITDVNIACFLGFSVSHHNGNKALCRTGHIYPHIISTRRCYYPHFIRWSCDLPKDLPGRARDRTRHGSHVQKAHCKMVLKHHLYPGVLWRLK